MSETHIDADDDKKTTHESSFSDRRAGWRSQIIDKIIALPSSGKAVLIGITSVVLAASSIIIILSLRSVDPGPEVFPSNKTLSPIWNETISPIWNETISPTWNETISPSISETTSPSNSLSMHPSTNTETVTPSNHETASPSSSTNTKVTMFPSVEMFIGDMPSAKPSMIPTTGNEGCVGNDSECSVSAKPSETPVPSSSPSGSPSLEPSSLPTDKPSMSPLSFPTGSPSLEPSSLPTDKPSISPSSLPTGSPSLEPSSLPSDIPSVSPSSLPSSEPTYTPAPTFILEETILDDKLFGPSSSQCNNYIPENGEYSFSFNLSSLPYFDDTLSDIEEVMFLVQMSHTDTNSNRTWSIKLGKGGHIYSFIGPYGESIPPNKQSSLQFVQDVNQKKAVDSTKNAQAWFSVHQSGPFQNADPGYSDQTPYFFSPNVAVYCSTTVPECRLASWGQQSRNTAWTERIIFYDRYRDCGDGILERTHLIHNAEPESSNTVLIFANMPWAGTRYSTLKDFVFSQNPATWDYNEYNLQGGIEDPMLIYGLEESYGLARDVPVTWTKGYTTFAQDLPFYEYPSTPQFKFPGKFPDSVDQPTLTLSYGPVNSAWLCQGPLDGFQNPSENNYRCRIADAGISMNTGCNQCYVRFTNSIGYGISVYHVRYWLSWHADTQVYFMYFNSYESLSTIQSVMTNGETITVTWDEVGKRPEDNLATSFVHGTSEQMVANQYSSSKIKFGYIGSIIRDYSIFAYMSYPNLAFGDTFRARQYYITDQFAGLNARSEAIVSDTVEEVILSGQLEMSTIKLHYIDNGNGQESTTFGLTVNDRPCITNSPTATTIACTGSSTPQVGKSAFVQIECGTSTYVGTDFYHFSNFPSTPYRTSNCKVDGVTTANRPKVKLLGYFSEAECDVTLQDKTFDVTFCS